MSEWKEYRLDEVVLIVDCEHKTAPFNERGEYYSVKTSNISQGEIDYPNCNRVDQDTYIIAVAKWFKKKYTCKVITLFHGTEIS